MVVPTENPKPGVVPGQGINIRLAASRNLSLLKCIAEGILVKQS